MHSVIIFSSFALLANAMAGPPSTYHPRQWYGTSPAESLEDSPASAVDVASASSSASSLFERPSISLASLVYGPSSASSNSSRLLPVSSASRRSSPASSPSPAVSRSSSVSKPSSSLFSASTATSSFTSASRASAAASSASAASLAVSSAPSISSSISKGFQRPTVSDSVGGKAICVTGNVPVKASTNLNRVLNLLLPANQSVVIESFIEYLQINSTLAAAVSSAPAQTASGTYNINSMICYPKNKGINATTAQLLTHGIGFDKSYWNFAPNYSYIDVAAENGYTTFSYDRLGTGLSDHPDPIQVVQSELEVAIAHSLAQSLRAGDFSSTKFAHVIGVGHSFGSIISVGQTAQYPKDLDAVVLTGFSTHTPVFNTFLTGINAAIARENQPSRFPNLNNGYLVSDTQISNQLGFFRLPNYPSANLVLAEASKQTFTIGELFTLTNPAVPATAFTGPIDVVNGENDWPFCQGNCYLPVNQAAAVKAIVYPAASAGSQSYLAEGAGHALNLHYSATAAFEQIQSFITTNGF